jgi:glycosyltransferase involved in cell wall biosynthesis
LATLLNQLRTQDYPKDAFEIVVIDNCSEDHTPQVVEALVARPGVPVRYVREMRLGISFARNKGAELARYPYLAYVDDDCSVGPDWLSQLVQGFDLHDNVVVVGGRVVLDWDCQDKPSWLIPDLEPWLGANKHLGAHPRLMGTMARVNEGNMALSREVWHATGGFLGMDQFGSKHMAAGEVLYLLSKIELQGGKIVFMPGAVVHHHIGLRSQRWMLGRAYWQGVSDGILDYLIHKRSWISATSLALYDSMALIALLGYTGFSYLKVDRARAFYHLLRAIRRFGLILSEMRLAGDWPLAKSWASELSPSP